MPVESIATTPETRAPWWRRDIELVVVIMLGIVSVATAYTSFQSSLYGGQSADKISQSEASATLAESLYLEGNQQYVQDSQTIQQLSALNIAANAGDAVASAQYDDLYFIGVSEDLDAAIQNAYALDESDPEFWHDPQADEAYLDALFSGYQDEEAYSQDLRAEGNDLGKKGDTLGLYTALMAITLFLLGIAAVVRRPLMKWILVATGGSIFLITAILVAGIPFVWIA
jgi:type II secretory pathway pseudopilin PulG